MRCDLFSDLSGAYARFRPTYPSRLFDYLAEVAPARGRAWDCATGNGQAAGGLAQRFAQVLATDGSARQIAQATPRANVAYAVADAEAAPFARASFDVVTVAQALHWLDRRRFFDEARRVLVPGGVLAVWCYGLMRVSPEVDGAIQWLYGERVGPYWPAERRLVDDGYRTLDFPFAELRATPRCDAVAEWNLSRLAGYLGTWSAVRRCAAETGADPVAEVMPRLGRAWGDPRGVRRVRFPLGLWVGRR